MLAIIIVLALPPKDSCKSRVSFESLYGICDVLLSTSVFMTCPKADKAKLIKMPYLDLLPVA
jgi:hypothetical protein